MIGSVGMQVCPADDQPIPDRESLLKTFVDEFVLIAPGVEQFPQSFEMGSEASPEEQPKHPVTLARPFHMAKYEVPQNLYEAVMGENPSRWKGPRNSVEMITWTDANTFCESVTALLREAHLIEQNDSIRLPSEAEWEYCCRAGTDTAYSFGDQATSPDDEGNKASLLDPYAWHTGNAAGNDPPVGALKANPWGLYDMHGYLWEFTADHWQDDHQSAPTDGSPRISSEEDAPIVVRGGSWKDRHPRLRSAARQSFKIDARDDAVGFRCVMDKAG
ncbi:MAG: formylglycine-generating enzyme family protein [Planctomycetaceae bacterium]|nr:formylglycine-generating enzyme family protein [Planctomycetaceae bacterium]